MVAAAEEEGGSARLGPGRVLLGQPRGSAEHDRGQPGLRVPLRHRLPLRLSTRRLMETLGARVHVIASGPPSAACSGARIDYVRALCAPDPRFVWLNQYAQRRELARPLRSTAPRSCVSSPTSTCCSSAPARPAR